MRKKVEKANIAKEKKAQRALKIESPEVEKDSFDAALDESNKSLSEKLGLSPAKGAKGKGKAKEKKADGMKQTKLNFGASKKSAEKEDKGSDKDELKDSFDEFDMALQEAAPLR